MKRTLKGIICLLVLALTLGAAAMFTACGGDKTIDKVTDLQFNFETGDFSFSGVEGAKEYRVRIFPFVDDGNGNMVESELPINESNAMRGGKDSYTGNVPMWSLTPGAEYNVYVLATSEDENVGDSTSDPVKGTYVAVYDAVEAGVTATISGTTITVELGNDAISDYYDSGANFDVTLYKDGAKVESKTIENADIEEEESESGGGKNFAMTIVPFGGKGPTTNYKATVTFDVDSADGTYTVTVTVKSTATYYKDSVESAPFAVTEANADQPVAPVL